MANILSNIVNHPKTTVSGLLIGLVTIAGVLSQQGITLGNAGKGTIVSLIAGVASALLGLLARDPGPAAIPPVPPAGDTQKLAALMLCSIVLMGSVAGCSGAQVAQDIVNWTPTIVSSAQVVGTVVSGLDPAIAPGVALAVAGFDVAAQTLANQAKAYLANPTSSLLQALQVQVTTFQQSVNSAVLSAVRITDPASQQKVLGALQGLAVGVNAILALVASIKGNTVSASKAAVKVAEIAPYLDRKQAVAMVAEHYGVSNARAMIELDWTQARLADVAY
jgi:hypothetical protein